MPLSLLLNEAEKKSQEPFCLSDATPVVEGMGGPQLRFTGKINKVTVEVSNIYAVAGQTGARLTQRLTEHLI